MRVPHQIECLEARIAPATIVVPVGGSSTYTLHASGSNLEIVDASHTVVWSHLASTVDVLEIDNADTANDTFTVDFADGNAMPSGGVVYQSTSAFHHGLAVLGDGTASAVYTPDASTAGAGSIVLNGAASLSFTGLNGSAAPVEFREMDSAKITLPNAGSTVALAAGTSILGHAALRVSGTSGASGFTGADFDGVVTLTVDSRTHAGDDIITLTGAGGSQGIVSLVVDAGTGADALTVSGTNTIYGSLDLISGGALTQASILTVGDHAVFTAGGALDFGGSLTRTDAGPDTAITLTGASILLHSQIRAEGATTAVTVNGPVSLSGDSSIAATGIVSFTGAVDNSGTAHFLTLSGSGVTLSGDLGAVSALLSLTATADDDVTLAGVKTLGGITLSAGGTLTLHGDTNSGNGDLSITTGGIVMDSTAALTGHGALSIVPATADATIGLAAAGSYDLSFSSADLVHFTNGFRSISFGRSDSTATITAGSAEFHDPLTLRTGIGNLAITGSLAGTGDASVTLLAGSGRILLGGSASIISTESQPITLVGKISLVDDAQILTDSTGTGADILTTSLIDGAHSLTLSGGTKGSVTLASAVGSVTPLTALVISGDTFNLPGITLSGSEALTARTINLNGSITTGVNSTLSLDGHVTASGNLTLSTGGGSFDNLVLDGTVLVDGSLHLIANEIDLNGAAGTITPSTAAATLSLAPFSAAQDLALGGSAPSAGTFYLSPTELATLGGGFAQLTIGHAAGTGTFSIDSPSLHGPVLLQNPKGPVLSTGALTVDGDLTLTGKTLTLTAGSITGTAAVTLNGPLSLGSSATISGGGHVIINGAVTDAGGTSNFLVTAGTTLDLLRSVSVGGNQSYTAPIAIDVFASLTGLHTGGSEYFHGPVILSDSPLPISFDTTNGDITFGSTLDSFFTPLKEFILNAGTGAVHFVGSVGASQPLNRFRIFSSSSVDFDGDLRVDGIISIVTDAIDFGGSIQSVTHSAISVNPSAATSVTVGGTAAPGSLAISNATLNALQSSGSGVTVGKSGLPLTIADDLSISGSQSLLFTGSRITIAAAQISAPGVALAFAVPVDLAVSTHVTGRAVTFSSTLDSIGAVPMDLTVETVTGNVVLGSSAGTLHALGNVTVLSGGATSAGRIVAASLTTDAGGSTLLNAAVTTTGAQNYGDPVTISVSTTVAGSTVHFNSSWAASKPLGVAVTASNGGIAFDGTVSGFSSLGAIATNGNVTFSGLVSLGTGSMNLQGNSVTIANPASSFGPLAVKATQDVMISKNTAIDLSNFTLLGDLTISAGGAITDSGNVNVAGRASFTTTVPASITLDSAGNHYVGAVSFTTDANATLVNASPTVLNAFAIGGALKVTSGGAITQIGPVQTGGTMSLTARTGTATMYDITLPMSGNTFGTVSFIGRNVIFSESAATDFGLSSLTGTLTANAVGAITQTGALTITGASSFTSVSGAVTLAHTGNRLTGPVGVGPAPGNDALLVNGRPTVLAGTTIPGRFQVNSTGTILQSGALNVGTLVLAAGTTGDVTLNTASNDFDEITITTGRTVRLLDINEITLAASTLSGSLDISASGAITQSGRLSVAGTSVFTIGTTGADVTLTDPANLFTGALAFNTGGLVAGENVTIVNAKATVLGVAHIDGDFSITSSGAFSDTGAVQVNGTTTFSAPDGFTPLVTLDTTANQYSGPVVFGANLGNVLLVNALPTKLGPSTLNGTLKVNSPAGISQTGPLSVAGTANFTTNLLNITLDDAGNHLHTALFSTKGGVKVVNADSLDLGLSSVGQSMEVTSGGAITDSGVVSVSGAATFTAATGITLDNANKLAAAIVLAPGTGASAKLVNARATNLGAMSIDGDFRLTSTGTLVQSGALTVGGDFTITAGGYDVTLNTAGNHFHAVSVAGKSVRLRDLDALTLGPSTASGLLDVTAGGAIGQTGALVVAGTSAFTKLDQGTAIDLSNASNMLAGAISFQTSTAAGSDVTLVNARATSLATSVIGGDLSVSASGNITDSGNVTVNGDASFTANPGQSAVAASTIILDSTGNHYTGSVSFGPSSVGAITLLNAQATSLGAASLTGLLRVQSGGNLTQTGPLIVGGASATFLAPGATVTLNDAGNFFNHVALTAGSSTVRNSASLDFLTSTVSGTLLAVSDGAITDTGVLTVTGDSTFNAGTAILLDSANKLSGTITLSPGATYDASLVNAVGAKLGASSLPGNLTVRATGGITQTGVLAVAGIASFTTGVSDITLPLANSLPRLQVVSGRHATITTSGDLHLGFSSVSGILTLEAGGVIDQSDSATVGTLALKANGDITFNGPSNKLASLGAITTQSSGGKILVNDSTLGLALAGAITTTATGLGIDIVTTGGSLALNAGSSVHTPNGTFILAIANALSTQRFYNYTTVYPFEAQHFAVYAGAKTGLTNGKIGNLTFTNVTTINGSYDPAHPVEPTLNVFYYPA